MIISHSGFVRMRNVSEKMYRKSKRTHFIFDNFLFEYRTVFEIMWKNMVEPERPQIAV